MANLSGISSESFVGKLLRAPLRLIPRKAIVPILQGPLRGKKWMVGSSTHGCWLGSYEYEKQNALQRCLKAGDVVYDVGANVGFYSLLASELVGDTGHVYSFEPLPDNLRELKRHLELNRIANCTVIDAAVSSADGEASFDLSYDRSAGHIADSGALRVRTLTLDRLVPEAGMRPPNLIKIDIEGSEFECLQGAAKLIQQSEPIIFLATHGPAVHSACTALLTGWSYHLESIDGRPVNETDELIGRPGGAGA